MRLEDLPDVLTINQVADYIGVSTPTIRRMIHDGDLHAIRARSRWRIPKWAVTDWIGDDWHGRTDR